jgi:hypothetical protein
MALISPLLKWIIYPQMMKGARQRRERHFMQAVEHRGGKR